jgi:ankyrin repeat protein
LLQAGDNPNEVDETGRTALHYAVARFQARGYLYVSELLQFGADPNMGDSIGATAIRYAAESGSEAILTLLLENGADPNLRTVGGGSPLGAAYIHGHMEAASLLEDYGAIIPSEAKRLQLKAIGHINATLRSSSKKVADESLQRRQARIARALHDLREKHSLHDQLSDDQIRRIAQEESSPEAEGLK